MRIAKFEELDSWKEARKLVQLVYELTNNKLFGRDFSFRDQIRRASVSVMFNVAEGFSRETNKEFLRGLWIAKASAAEIQSLSYSALDLGYFDDNQKEKIYEQAEKVSKLISGMIKYLRHHSKTRQLVNPITKHS